jgi:hypothetical protein
VQRDEAFSLLLVDVNVMDSLTLVLIAIQVGVIGAVSALVAPTVFKTLEPSAAGPFLGRLFPRYFVTGAILSLLASVFSVLGDHLAVAAILGMDGLCFIAAWGLVPSINAAKDRGDPSFARLHLVSVVLNMTGLVLAIVAMGVIIAQ